MSTYQGHHVVKAVHDFYSLKKSDLNFEKGTIIEVIDSENPHEWYGKIVTTNQFGTFPPDIVKTIYLDDKAPPPKNEGNVIYETTEVRLSDLAEDENLEDILLSWAEEENKFIEFTKNNPKAALKIHEQPEQMRPKNLRDSSGASLSITPRASLWGKGNRDSNKKSLGGFPSKPTGAGLGLTLRSEGKASSIYSRSPTPSQLGRLGDSSLRRGLSPGGLGGSIHTKVGGVGRKDLSLKGRDRPYSSMSYSEESDRSLSRLSSYRSESRMTSISDPLDEEYSPRASRLGSLSDRETPDLDDVLASTLNQLDSLKLDSGRSSSQDTESQQSNQTYLNGAGQDSNELESHRSRFNISPPLTDTTSTLVSSEHEVIEKRFTISPTITAADSMARYKLSPSPESASKFDLSPPLPALALDSSETNSLPPHSGSNIQYSDSGYQGSMMSGVHPAQGMYSTPYSYPYMPDTMYMNSMNHMPYYPSPHPYYPQSGYGMGHSTYGGYPQSMMGSQNYNMHMMSNPQYRSGSGVDNLVSNPNQPQQQQQQQPQQPLQRANSDQTEQFRPAKPAEKRSPYRGVPKTSMAGGETYNHLTTKLKEKLKKTKTMGPMETLLMSSSVGKGKYNIDISLMDFYDIDTKARATEYPGAYVSPSDFCRGALTNEYTDEISKSRAIFVWILKNISYPGRHKPVSITGTETPEFPKDVWEKKVCKREGFAILFHEMAQACGLESYIITGYQKGPTEEHFGSSQTPLPNHWWNAVKINGEFRFIDIGSASPLHLYNHLKQPDYFYFLAHPLHLIYTHFPNNPKFQFLSPPISPKTFWSLPYIQPNFFYDEVKFIDYTDSVFHLEDDETAEFSIILPSGLGCFAEVDIPNKNATYFNHLRTLVHMSEQDGQNVARIIIRLNKGKGTGFLKVFTGPKIQAPTNTNPYPLSFSFMLKHTGDKLPNDFVMTFFTEHDFTIKEPRDLILKCGRGYRFVVATPCATKPIKLSVRSPSQHNNVFSYFPDEHSYAAEVFLKEPGKWVLAYLTGKDKWIPFAQYECH